MTITLTIDTKPVENLLQIVPNKVLAAVGRYAFSSLLEHRLKWLAKKGPRFGRGGRGIKVSRIESIKPNSVAKKEVVYYVPPKAQPRTQTEALKMLQQFEARIYTGSLVLAIHQQGLDLTTTRWMAIPIKVPRTASTPKAWRAKYPKRKLREFPSRRHPGELVLRTRSKPKRAGDKPVWVTRFRLTKNVKFRPTLQFYETWDQLAPFRDKLWVERVNQIYRDLIKAPLRRSI